MIRIQWKSRMIRILHALLFLAALLLYSCQQKIDDDSSSFGVVTPITYYNVAMVMDSYPFDPSFDATGRRSLYASQLTDGVFHFTNTFTTGIRYTMYFVPNSSGYRVLWSGEEGKRNLVLYSRSGYNIPVAMQRPMKVAFEVDASGTYVVQFDTKKMTYDFITGPGLIIKENTISSVQLISDFPGLSFASPSSVFTLAGDSLRITLTNLVPGVAVPFRIVYNGNPNEALARERYNSVTYNNQLLDAILNPDDTSDFELKSFTPTSEIAFFYYNPYSRTFTIDQISSPYYGDGYFDSGFYGPPILSNSNRNISNVYMKSSGSAWYVAVDGTMTATNGIPLTNGGVRFVLFIDDQASTSGLQNTWVKLYHLMDPIFIPMGKSVEYILVMETTDSGQTTEGLGNIKDAIKMYGPLDMSMTNVYEFIDYGSTNNIEKPLYPYPHQWNQPEENGFVAYGDVYEIVLPIYGVNGPYSGILPTDSIEVCMVAWSAHTNWNDLSNTNVPWPIVYANPPAASSNELSSGAWHPVN